MDDLSCQIRLARAMAAFKSDPKESCEDLFTENFISRYVLEVDRFKLGPRNNSNE